MGTCGCTARGSCFAVWHGTGRCAAAAGACMLAHLTGAKIAALAGRSKGKGKGKGKAANGSAAEEAADSTTPLLAAEVGSSTLLFHACSANSAAAIAPFRQAASWHAPARPIPPPPTMAHAGGRGRGRQHRRQCPRQWRLRERGRLGFPRDRRHCGEPAGPSGQWGCRCLVCRALRRRPPLLRAGHW